MSSELPSGTVTFLFTDIERSTQTMEAMGNEAYADALDTHRQLLRDAFKTHGGHEVGTEGDAFFVAFSRADDAVQAAVEGQAAIDGQPLRVRMGMHTGEALLRSGEYVGHDVHKAKRVCDAGHGGQILVSQATASLVEMELRDLGPHRLKDLGEPQRLFQVGEGEFPKLRSLEAVTNNLPVQLTSFAGRERELEEIAEMLAKSRLVTLTGVGGCGKTRLAIHAAGAELDRIPDGVFFCDLSRISEEGTLAATVASAIGVDTSAEGIGSLPSPEAVRGYLARRHTLLVLDNCEHLVDAVAKLAEDLLTSCPDLHILATSREALEIEGEHAWSVPSLSTDAAQLFAERAAAVRAGFVLTDDNASDVAAICQRLDGLPLAIELAAAQIGHLAPRQIAERLDDRFLILTGGRRRLQRQQTLQAAMDWSWDLLPEKDRTLLARLAVFQGGCTLEAVEDVCGESLDVVTGLRSLVAKSLVAREDRGDAVRYRLLETVRMYAEDKLADSVEVPELRTRHRDHYLARAESVFDDRGTFYNFHGSELEADQDNVRAALRWSEAQDRPDLVARLLCATSLMWAVHQAEGIQRMGDVLSTELGADLRGRVLACLAWIEFNTGVGGEAHADEAVALLGEDPSPWLYISLAARASRTAIQAVATQDDARTEVALAMADRALAVGRLLGSRWTTAGHVNRGGVLITLLRHTEAAEAYAEYVRTLPEPDPVFSVALAGLFVARHVRPDAWTEGLDSALRSGIDRNVRLGYRLPAVWAVDHAEHGRVDEACAHIRDYTERIRGLAPPLGLRLPVLYAGVVAGVSGEPERAARLLAAAFKPGIIIDASGYALYRHWVPRVRAQLDPVSARRLRDEGRAMSLDEALDYAIEERDA